MKTRLVILGHFDNKEGQLISDDALYQMVDLCDDNDDSLSDV